MRTFTERESAFFIAASGNKIASSMMLLFYMEFGRVHASNAELFNFIYSNPKLDAETRKIMDTKVDQLMAISKGEF